jgi:peptidoglycan/LPS O-acetylase OafA/YrhL
MVVTGHILGALWPTLLSPAPSTGETPLVIQLPFIRVIHSGRVSIAIFALITGYVNSVKPVKLVRAGEIDKALSSIALSSFKRTGRLVLPTSVATLLAWLTAQLGGFEAARYAAQPWIRNISPPSSKSWMEAIGSLLENMVTTWTKGANDYDKVQWTISFFLKAAMLTYMTLIATAYVQSHYRLQIYAALYIYYWCAGDGREPVGPFRVRLVRMLTVFPLAALIGINIAFGTILAEITQSSAVETITQQWKHACALLPWCLITLGLFVCSFPSENPGWSDWSHCLARWVRLVMPGNGELSRYAHSVGAQILVLGVLFSPGAKRALSNKVIGWMGKTSFAVYLIHPLFIRTILVWTLYGTLTPPQGQNKDGEPARPTRMPWDGVNVTNIAAFPIFYATLYLGASYWVRYVDHWCGLVMQRLEALMFDGKLSSTYDKVLLPK